MTRHVTWPNTRPLKRCVITSQTIVTTSGLCNTHSNAPPHTHTLHTHFTHTKDIPGVRGCGADPLLILLRRIQNGRRWRVSPRLSTGNYFVPQTTGLVTKTDSKSQDLGPRHSLVHSRARLSVHVHIMCSCYLWGAGGT